MLIEYVRFINFATVDLMSALDIPCRNYDRYPPEYDETVMWFEIRRHWKRDEWEPCYIRIPKSFKDEDRFTDGIIQRHHFEIFDHKLVITKMDPKLWPTLLRTLRSTFGRYNIDLQGEVPGGLHVNYYVPFVAQLTGKCVIGFEDLSDAVLFKLIWPDASLLAEFDDA